MMDQVTPMTSGTTPIKVAMTQKDVVEKEPTGGTTIKMEVENAKDLPNGTLPLMKMVTINGMKIANTSIAMVMTVVIQKTIQMTSTGHGKAKVSKMMNHTSTEQETHGLEMTLDHALVSSTDLMKKNTSNTLHAKDKITNSEPMILKKSSLMELSTGLITPKVKMQNGNQNNATQTMIHQHHQAPQEMILTLTHHPEQVTKNGNVKSLPLNQTKMTLTTHTN